MTVRQLAELLGGAVAGDGEVVVRGVASLDTAGPGDVTFVADARRVAALAETKAGAAIIPADVPAGGLPLIRVDDVQAALAGTLEIVGEDEHLPPVGVHPSAVVAAGARLGEGVRIGPGAVIGAEAVIGAAAAVCANVVVEPGAEIGDATVLFPGTVIQRRCRIGRNCRIGPCAVIGSGGLGYYFAAGRHNRIPHTGIVEIGDEVDIGACSCVDRPKFGITTVGEGTKLDNLVQVAHNVHVGRHCVLAALVGVGGSAVLKDYVILGGHVGVRDNTTVGTGSKCGAWSGIAQDIPDGTRVAGTPARPLRQELRTWHLISRLPVLYERIKELEKKVARLESSADNRRAD